MSGPYIDRIHGEHVGIVIREAVRRVIVNARQMRFTAEARVKATKQSGGDDWVTEADTLGQKIVVRLLMEHFVNRYGWGIIGEEEDPSAKADPKTGKKKPLFIPCRVPGHEIYFTIDPIDGTGAFVRKQSHGVGSMISLVVDGEVVAVCIGDINTGELYYYRPGSVNTHRISDDLAVPLIIDTDRTLASQAICLRSMPYELSSIVQAMLKGVPGQLGLFKKGVGANGSIGISMATLWKGEVGGAVMALGNSTPWDSNPVIGMSRRLGFDFYHLIPSRDGSQIRPGGTLERFIPTPVQTVVKEPHEIFVVHSSRREEIRRWAGIRGIQVSVLA